MTKKLSNFMRLVSIIVAMSMVMTTMPANLYALPRSSARSGDLAQDSALAPQSVFKKGRGESKSEGGAAKPGIREEQKTGHYPQISDGIIMAGIKEQRKWLRGDDIAAAERSFIACATFPLGRRWLISELVKDENLLAKFAASQDPYIRDTAFLLQKIKEYLSNLAGVIAVTGENPPLLRNFGRFLVLDENVLEDVTAIARVVGRDRLFPLLKDCLDDAGDRKKMRHWCAANRVPIVTQDDQVPRPAEGAGKKSPLDVRLADLEHQDLEAYQQLVREVLPLLNGDVLSLKLAEFRPKPPWGQPESSPSPAAVGDGRQILEKIFTALNQNLIKTASAGKVIQETPIADAGILDDEGQIAYHDMRTTLSEFVRTGEVEDMPFGNWIFYPEWIAGALAGGCAAIAAAILISAAVWPAVSAGVVFGVLAYFFVKPHAGMISVTLLTLMKTPSSVFAGVLFNANMILHPLEDEKTDKALPLIQQIRRDAQGPIQNAYYYWMLNAAETEWEMIREVNGRPLPAPGTVLSELQKTRNLQLFSFTYNQAIYALMYSGEAAISAYKPYAQFLARQAQRGAPWAEAILKELVVHSEVKPDVRAMLADVMAESGVPSVIAKSPPALQWRTTEQSGGPREPGGGTASLRLPTVKREDVQGKWLSIDTEIQTAQIEGRVRRVGVREARSLARLFKEKVLRSEYFGEHSLRLARDYVRLFPSGRKDEGVVKDLRTAFRDAVGLLEKGDLVLCVVKGKPHVPEKPVMGFYPRPNEVCNDTGEDASNLPFPVRRIGNKLYMTEDFFNAYSGLDPSETSIFWEALLHDLLEDERIAGRFRVADEKRHAFACMMTPALAPPKAGSARALHVPTNAPCDLSAWAIQFYTPEQLTALLRVHPGAQAASLIDMALARLLVRQRRDLVEPAVLTILNGNIVPEPRRGSSAKKRARKKANLDERVLEALRLHARAAAGEDILEDPSRPDVEAQRLRKKMAETARAVMAQVELAIYDRLSPVWKKFHAVRLPLHDQLKEWIESGQLDYEDTASLTQSVQDREFLGHALHYVGRVFDWLRPRDCFSKMADCLEQDIRMSVAISPAWETTSGIMLLADLVTGDIQKPLKPLERLHAMPPAVRALASRVSAAAGEVYVLAAQYEVSEGIGEYRAKGSRIPMGLVSNKGKQVKEEFDTDRVRVFLRNMEKERPEDYRRIRAFVDDVKELARLCRQYEDANVGDLIAANTAAMGLTTLGLNEEQAYRLVLRLAGLSALVRKKEWSTETMYAMAEKDEELMAGVRDPQMPHIFYHYDEEWPGILLVRMDILGRSTMGVFIDSDKCIPGDLEKLGFSPADSADGAIKRLGFWVSTREGAPVDAMMTQPDSIDVKLTTYADRLALFDRRLLGQDFQEKYGFDFSKGGHRIAEVGIGYPPQTPAELAARVNADVPAGRPPNTVLAIDRNYPTAILESQRPGWLKKAGKKTSSLEIVFDSMGRVLGVLAGRILMENARKQFSPDDLMEMSRARIFAQNGQPLHPSEKYTTPREKYGHPAMEIREGDAMNLGVPSGSLDMIRCFNVYQYYSPQQNQRMLLEFNDCVRENGIVMIGRGGEDTAHRVLQYFVYRKEKGMPVAKEMVIHPRAYPAGLDQGLNTLIRTFNKHIRQKSSASLESDVDDAKTLVEILCKAGIPAVAGADGLVSIPLEPSGMAQRIPGKLGTATDLDGKMRDKLGSREVMDSAA